MAEVLAVVMMMVWIMGWKSGFVFVIGKENEEWNIGGEGLWGFGGFFLAVNLWWWWFWWWQ